MPSDPRIRASDADRDRAAEALREHHATGRLTVEEFQERLDRIYAAKTLGELDAVMADLPAIDLYQLPIPANQRFVPPPRPPARHVHGRMSPVWRAAWGSWAGVSLILTVIWLITVGAGSGGAAYFWPVWVIGPWGALMLGRWIFGGGPQGGPGDRGQGRDEARARRRDMHDQLRAQRHQLRRDLRSGRGDVHGGPPDPGGDRPADG
jgi:hypothetical protein